MSLAHGSLHPGLAIAGLGVGVASLGIAFIARKAERAVDLACFGAAVVLVVQQDVSPLLIVAVVLAAAGWESTESAHTNLTVLVPALGVAVAGLAIRDAAWSRAVVDLGGLLLVWVGRRLPGPSRTLVGPILIAGMVAATWAGAPDTEAAVVVGAAVVPALLVSGLLADRPARPAPTGSWTAALVLALWAAGDGYRGRQAGLAAAVVGLAALVAWAGEANRRRRGGRGLGARAVVAFTVLSLGAMALAARTMGRAHRASAPADLLAGAVLLAALVSAALRHGGAADAGPPGAGRSPA